MVSYAQVINAQFSKTETILKFSGSLTTTRNSRLTGAVLPAPPKEGYRGEPLAQ